MKKLLLDAAKSQDVDADHLPDEWERFYFGSLDPTPASDPDADGSDNFTEFAFGADPTQAWSFPQLGYKLTVKSQGAVLSATFRRCAGSILDYILEASPDLQSWTSGATQIGLFQPMRNTFDGTGTSVASYYLKTAVTNQPQGFLRVRATPRQKPQGQGLGDRD